MSKQNRMAVANGIGDDSIGDNNSVQVFPRRHALGLLAATSIASTGSWALAEPAKRRSAVLARSKSIALLQTRSRVELEVEGVLRIEEPDPHKEQKIRTAKVQGKSTLEYYEAAAYTAGEPVAARRRYTLAKSQNWISGSDTNSQLRPSCHNTIALPRDGLWSQYSPADSMLASEVELVQSPLNTTVLELLLPKQPAKPSVPWKLDAGDARQLFNLEAVHKCSIESKITNVEKGKATIHISGQIDGAANSVPTSLSISGNYQVTLGQSSPLVNWAGIVIKENRSISEAEPGFEVTAQIKLIRAESAGKIPATAPQLKKLASDDHDGNWLVKMNSLQGQYTMLADRRWTTFIDGGEEAILRMVENNSVIAQCNVMRLSKLSAGQQLTLEGLQAEVKQSVGEGFEQLLESSEKVTSNGLRLIRVVAMGQREEIPIQWVYDHLSDDTGRRIALIYTMGGNVTDKFAAADEQMTASFEFVAPQATKAATRQSTTRAAAR